MAALLVLAYARPVPKRHLPQTSPCESHEFSRLSSLTQCLEDLLAVLKTRRQAHADFMSRTAVVPIAVVRALILAS